MSIQVDTTSFLSDLDLTNGMSYEKYFLLIKELLEEGKTTGKEQKESQLKHARLNFQRMKRVYRTARIIPELEDHIKSINTPQEWIVLTEGWCGDAAQSLPLIARLAELNDQIKLTIVLRDENLELMDRYLTNGSRSIPKMIVFDVASGKELYSWGPRPEPLQELVMEHKRNPVVPKEQFDEQLHRTYTDDKTNSLQQELLAKIQES